jgi:hypothetical protein
VFSSMAIFMRELARLQLFAGKRVGK